MSLFLKETDKTEDLNKGWVGVCVCVCVCVCACVCVLVA